MRHTLCQSELSHHSFISSQKDLCMNPTSSDNNSSAHDRLWELLHDIRFALLTSRRPSGHLSSRPLTTQNDKQDHGTVLKFFVSVASEWVDGLQGDPMVGVGYADPSSDRYVSISGKARVTQNFEQQKILWSTMAQSWFPGGPTDPALRLLEVDIDAAEYWDVKANKMVQLLKMATAAITGEPPTDMAEHRKLSMGSVG
jgi:general stress protein 26